MRTDTASEPQLSPFAPKEWLVTDRRGAFAMGTPSGMRIRKYHGFFMGIAGRAETAYLADLEIIVNGESLWPHRYRAGEQGESIVIYPLPRPERFRFRQTPLGPMWQWRLKTGSLKFLVKPHQPGGIELIWGWDSPTSRVKFPAELRIRPFFAMRNLHGNGGRPWHWAELGKREFRITSDSSDEIVHGLIQGEMQWVENPDWYYNFLYAEETQRGYDDHEDLFSAGMLTAQLKKGETCGLVLAQDPADLAIEPPQPIAQNGLTSAALFNDTIPAPIHDFVLTRPAGIVAGYPWFGEWGRDTFVSLPGMAYGWLKAGGDPEQVRNWAYEVLLRWGEWIQPSGMLPNLIEKKGAPQWESADATLWWIHSLAALWSLSIAGKNEFAGIESRFLPLLDVAIESIREGRHRFLRLAEDGQLEVTEPHTTWMDARVDGAPVTPRTGRLPEIEALWFQARTLQKLWSGQTDLSSLEELGRRALEHREAERPNSVFLHSLPLAPSFVLGDWASAVRDLQNIVAEFWTPVGLRSLSPENPLYQARCIGNQRQRDQAYHQGPVWAWLGGHFEMAKNRLALQAKRNGIQLPPEMFPTEAREEMPVSGHIPEIFDAEEPYVARGAPAQAWSLACLEEARIRKKLKADAKLTEILASRWLGRETRRARPPGGSLRRTT